MNLNDSPGANNFKISTNDEKTVIMMMTMIRMRNGGGYWGFTGHAQHKSVPSLAYFDWTLIYMSPPHDGDDLQY